MTNKHVQSSDEKSETENLGDISKDTQEQLVFHSTILSIKLLKLMT